jgi:hypothetical protein
MFTKNQLESWLEEISSFITKPVSIYLIGGGSMSFRGIKQITKDIDLVTLARKDFEIVDSAIKNAGYKCEEGIKDEFYLTALAVYLRRDSRIDVFLEKVGKMLLFSQAMKHRATLYRKIGNLSVYLASPEDVFIFKSMTTREGDVVDCRTLIEETLDWDAVYSEIKEQSEGENKWFFWTFEKVCAIENSRGIILPIKKKLLGLVIEYWDKKPSDFMDGIANVEKHIPEKKLRDQLN